MSEDLGKAVFKVFKGFASSCKKRKMNPEGWEAKASSGRKAAAKARREEWQQWAVSEDSRRKLNAKVSNRTFLN